MVWFGIFMQFLPESASDMEWEYVVVELKLMEESGLAICLGLSEVLINRAKFGVKPQLGSVGVVGSFLHAENIKDLIKEWYFF